MPRAIWLVSLLAAVAAAVWTAAPVGAEEETAGRPVVAIMDFAAGAVPTDIKEAAGKVCANTLAEELVRLKFYDVAERARMEKVLSEIKLGASGLVNEENAAQIGKLLAVKYLVFGDVQSIDIGAGTASAVAGALGTLGGGLFGGAAKKVKGTSCRVAVNYKVVDVETGKVFLQKTYKEDLDVTHAAEGPDARLKLVNETLQKTACKMAKAMLPKVEGIVAAVDAGAGTLIVTIGSQHGIQPETMLHVIRKGAEVKNPVTGEVIDVQITEVCKARCLNVRDKASTLEIGDLVKARRGNKVEWKPFKEKAAEIKVGDVVAALDE